MRPVKFRKSSNLFYSNIVGRPVKLACLYINQGDLGDLKLII